MKKNTIKIGETEIEFTCTKVNPGDVTIGSDPQKTYEHARPVLEWLLGVNQPKQ